MNEKRKVADTSLDDLDGDGKKRKGHSDDIGRGLEILDRLDEMKRSFMEQYRRVREKMVTSMEDLRQEMKTELAAMKREREEVTKKMEEMIVE